MRRISKLQSCERVGRDMLRNSCIMHLIPGDAELPPNPFTILEPCDQDIGEFYLVQERRATDFEASKL